MSIKESVTNDTMLNFDGDFDGDVACEQTLTFCRADVQITDLEDFIPLIELNIKQNEAALRGKAEAKTLKWGEDLERFLSPPDYILFADCIYYEEVSSFTTWGSLTGSEGERESEISLSVTDPGFLRKGGCQLQTTKEGRNLFVRSIFCKLHKKEEN